MTAVEQAFTQRGARSAGMLVGLTMAMLVESVAVHAMIARKWPVADVVLIALNVLTVMWLARNYRAVGEVPILVREGDLWIRHGSTVSAQVPWPCVREVKLAAWRDQPPDAASGFLKLSGGDDPNVLVACDPPVDVKVLGIGKRVRLFGLRLDDAKGFVDAANAQVAPR